MIPPSLDFFLISPAITNTGGNSSPSRLCSNKDDHARYCLGETNKYFPCIERSDARAWYFERICANSDVVIFAGVSYRACPGGSLLRATPISVVEARFRDRRRVGRFRTIRPRVHKLTNWRVYCNREHQKLSYLTRVSFSERGVDLRWDESQVIVKTFFAQRDHAKGKLNVERFYLRS